MPNNKTANVLNQIEKHYALLSPAGKRIAQYLQQTPLAVISQSTAQIAEKHKHQKPRSAVSFGNSGSTPINKQKTPYYRCESKVYQ